MNKSISTATKLAQSGFWVFVSSTTSGHKSCICDTINSCRLFLIERAHIAIYIIIRTWIQGTGGQRNQYKLVRFSWNCNRANQWILFASRWPFPKDPRDMSVIGNKEDSISRSSLNVLFNGWSLIRHVISFLHCFA